MPTFCDTSFLCALYRRQSNTDRAVAMASEARLLRCTNLVYFEFSHAVRFEVFRHKQDHTKGYGELEGMSVLSQFELGIESGTIEVVPIDFAVMLGRAILLSENHTIRLGVRAFDLLHVAAAVSVGATRFLTFDTAQRNLAEAEGLEVPA